MLPLVLNTPSTIYDAVKAHFIYARLNVTSTNPVEIDISLKLNLPVIHLSSAVNKDIFEQTLNSYYLCTKINDLVGSTTPYPYLDPSKFSVAEPLTDWKRFRRLMCATEGKQCLDVIIEFLLDPSDENLLKVSNLGFDPESSTQHLSDIDIEYFQDFPKKIIEMNLAKRKEVVKQIQLNYPSVFDKFKDELSFLVKEMKQTSQVKDDFFLAASYVNTATVISNISYAIFPNPVLLGLNVLIRFSGIIAALYHKKHVAGVSGLINAVAMLNFKSGLMMTPIDLISVGFLCYHYSHFKCNDHQKAANPEKKFYHSKLAKDIQSARLNVKELNQAYVWINIPENKKTDFEFITARYTTLRDRTVSRQSKLPQMYAEQLQFFIDDYDEAYKTICSHLPAVDSNLPKEPWWEKASLTID